MHRFVYLPLKRTWWQNQRCYAIVSPQWQQMDYSQDFAVLRGIAVTSVLLELSFVWLCTHQFLNLVFSQSMAKKWCPVCFASEGLRVSNLPNYITAIQRDASTAAVLSIQSRLVHLLVEPYIPPSLSKYKHHMLLPLEILLMGCWPGMGRELAKKPPSH